MAGNQTVLVAARGVSADRKPAGTGGCQSAVVDKLGVSPSQSYLFTGPQPHHLGIVQQAQGRSAETAVSPHHDNQSNRLHCL
jgi:hypothetical protein